MAGLRGYDLFPPIAQQVGDHPEYITGLDAVHQFDPGFEEAWKGRGVVQLDVSRAFPVVLHRVPYDRRRLGAFDHAQHAHDVQAPFVVAVDTLGIAVPRTHPFRIDRGNAGVPGDGERASVVPRVRAPDDRHVESTGHLPLPRQDIGIGMQHVPHRRVEPRDQPAAVQIDQEVGLADHRADHVCDPFGDGAVFPAGAGPGQVQAVLRGSLAAPVGRLVDDRDQGDRAAEFTGIQGLFQPPYGPHGFEFVAVYTSKDEQFRAGRFPGNGNRLQLDGA